MSSLDALISQAKKREEDLQSATPSQLSQSIPSSIKAIARGYLESCFPADVIEALEITFPDSITEDQIRAEFVRSEHTWKLRMKVGRDSAYFAFWLYSPFKTGAAQEPFEVASDQTTLRANGDRLLLTVVRAEEKQEAKRLQRLERERQVKLEQEEDERNTQALLASGLEVHRQIQAQIDAEVTQSQQDLWSWPAGAVLTLYTARCIQASHRDEDTDDPAVFEYVTYWTTTDPATLGTDQWIKLQVFELDKDHNLSLQSLFISPVVHRPIFAEVKLSSIDDLPDMMVLTPKLTLKGYTQGTLTYKTTKLQNPDTETQDWYLKGQEDDVIEIALGRIAHPLIQTMVAQG